MLHIFGMALRLPHNGRTLFPVMAEFHIVIPFPGGNQAEADKGHGYHGILRLANVQEDTLLPAPGARQGRPLAVFNHGLLADKNALFFQSLASEPVSYTHLTLPTSDLV